MHYKKCKKEVTHRHYFLNNICMKCTKRKFSFIIVEKFRCSAWDSSGACEDIHRQFRCASVGSSGIYKGSIQAVQVRLRGKYMQWLQDDIVKRVVQVCLRGQFRTATPGSSGKWLRKSSGRVSTKVQEVTLKSSGGTFWKFTRWLQ